MRIDRFGDQYASAYQLGQDNMQDSWSINRPAVFARVGGLPGVFDFYGDIAFPFEPFIFNKKFALHANGDREAVETEIAALRAATIERTTESKLWILRRTGGTKYVYAKCTSLTVAENWNSSFPLMVTVEFFCRQGAWGGA